MSCLAPVTWKEESRTWVPYDYATDVKHRCQSVYVESESKMTGKLP